MNGWAPGCAYDANVEKSARESHTSSLYQPNDVIELPGLRSVVLILGSLAVAHNTHDPGWRWSIDVQHVVGTRSCLTRHVGYALSGQMQVLLDDGHEYTVHQNDLFEVPPGHDSWVVGDEAFVSVEWTGARSWIPSLESLSERILTTILITDIVGSTEVALRLGDGAWTDLVATFEERVRDTLARYGGREVRTTGDGVLAVFTGAGRALRCAFALRDVAGQLGWQIRSSIHTGEVDVAGSDIRGIAVHEAARILDLATPGEILVSSTIRDLLSSEFAFEDRGEHELRGLPGTRRVFAVV